MAGSPRARRRWRFQEKRRSELGEEAKAMPVLNRMYLNGTEGYRPQPGCGLIVGLRAQLISHALTEQSQMDAGFPIGLASH